MRPRNNGSYLDYNNPVTQDWSSKNEHPPTFYSLKSGQTVHWECHVCHYEWDTSIAHRTKDGSGCPKCANRMSKSEKYIANYLSFQNILFEQEYIFPDCRDINPLPFDFYLPDYNTCIEYDGQQHFYPVKFSSNENYDAEAILKNTQKHDKIKNDYCHNNNITLFRISYKDNLDESLNDIIPTLINHF